LLPQLSSLREALTPIPVLADRNGNGVEQILIPYRLCEEVDGTQLHRSYGHGDVAKAGHQNDRQSDIDACKIRLQLEAAGPGQPDIEHQACRSIGQFDVKEI